MMKTPLLHLLDKTLDALPLTAAAICLTVLSCILSGVMRDLLLQADLDMLAAAVALLPLTTVLLAFGWSMRSPRQRFPRRQRSPRQTEVERRKALLRATYDIEERS
ncbi:hypothetical protein [Herbaspirillum seropedicae]|nr:hypothetical protein [Herbaspirillum seropedicae]